MLMRARPICGAPRHDGDLVDVVGTARSGVDPARDAILQGEGRPFLGAAGMDVDVDQAGGHDLAARVDRLGGIARKIGFDGDDLAAGDSDVARCVETDRGVDHASALDEDVVGCRESVRSAGKHGGSRSCCAEKVASIHHRHSSSLVF